MVTRRLLLTALAAVVLVGCSEENTAPPPTTSAAPTTSSPTRTGTLSPTQSTTSSPTRTTSDTTEGRPTTGAGERGSPRGGTVSHVQETNAASVASAYARTALTFDTKLDNSRNDGQRRAARWMTPELARQVSRGLPASSGWDALRRDDTWTKVSVTDVTPSGGDPSTGLDAERLLQADVTTHTKRTNKPRKRTTTMSVTLTRTAESKPWRVSDMQTY